MTQEPVVRADPHGMLFGELGGWMEGLLRPPAAQGLRSTLGFSAACDISCPQGSCPAFKKTPPKPV